MRPHLDDDGIGGLIGGIIMRIIIEIVVHLLFQWLLIHIFHAIGQYFGLTRGWALLYIPVGIGFGWAVHEAMKQVFQSGGWGVVAGVIGCILLLMGTAYVHRYFLGDTMPVETEL